MVKCKTETCANEVDPPKLLCAECKRRKASENNKKWASKNKESRVIYRKKWNESNKEYRHNYNVVYHQKHKDRLNAHHYQWYRENIDRERTKDAEYRKTPERRFNASKQIAKRRGFIFTLSLYQYKSIISLPCYYCNHKLCAPIESGSGLDRLDSSRGYEPDNVVSCGKICNSIKMDYLTVEETKAAVEAILKVRLSNGRSSEA